MFANKKEKKAAWDEFVNDNAARECGLITDDGIKLGPIDLNEGRKLSRLFDVNPKDYEPDEDLEREREQEKFGRQQNAWVTGGHEQ
jgi:hypothetical protein